jgi:Prion-inhibition and propagation
MVDPLNAAGLVLAALTVPGQLFSSCTQAYTTVAGIRDAGPALNKQLWLFKVQHTRFLVWGQVGPTTLSLMGSACCLYTDVVV